MTEKREYTQEEAQAMYAFIENKSHLFWAVQDTEITKESEAYKAGAKYDGSKAWEMAVAMVTDEAAALVKYIDSQQPDAAGEGES